MNPTPDLAFQSDPDSPSWFQSIPSHSVRQTPLLRYLVGVLQALSAALLLFSFYILSVGPAIWIYERPQLKESKTVSTVLSTVYAPIDQIKEWPGVDRFLEAYLKLWGWED